MLDKDAWVKVADLLSEDDFYEPRHQVIYSAIVELFSKNAAIDILTVSNLLEERKLMEKAGNAGYLAELVANVPSAANVVYYAEIVRKKGTLRKLSVQPVKLPTWLTGKRARSKKF